MVRDTDDDTCEEPALKPAATSASFRRAEQLKRWEESETNRVVPLPKPVPQRVRFPEKCVFLAACSSGDIEEVAHLLDRGADVNATNVDGMTGLHQAVIVENLEMVSFLLERGAYIDAQDNEGWSPLMAGVSCNFVDIVRCLLQHGADPVLCNSDGELPIDLAEEDEMRDLLQQEIRSRGLSVDEGRTREEKLMLEDSIAWAKSPRIVKEHRHPSTGATPTHVAAAKGYCKVLRILLQAGSDVNAKDNEGWTPLHAAAHWGEKEACELLIDHHAQMDIQNNMGLTCVDVSEPDLVNFLEKSKEKRKLLTAASSALNSQPSRRVVMCQQQPSIKQASPRATALSEPATTNPLSPTGVQLPAWRLTGRRATSTSSPATPTTLAPPANVAVAAPNDAKNRPDAAPLAITANTTVGDGASPAKRRAAADTVAVHTNEDHSRLSSSGNGQRGDESEAERKLRARRERESRRSTQGITLETIKAAENVTLASDRKRRSTSDVKEAAPKDSAATANTAATTDSTTATEPAHIRPEAAALSNAATSAASLARLSANLNSTLRNFDEFIATPANTSRLAAGAADKDKFVAKFIPPLSTVGATASTGFPAAKLSAPAGDSRSDSQAAPTPAHETQASVSGVPSQVPNSAKSTILTAVTCAGPSLMAAAAPSSSSSASRARRGRAGRRSTGPIAQDDVHLAAGDSASPAAPTSNGGGDDQSTPSMAPDKENDSSGRRTAPAKTAFAAEPTRGAVNKATTQSRYTSKPVFAFANLSDYRNNRSAAYLSSVTNDSNSNTSCHNGPASDRFSSRTSSGVSVSSSSGGQDADIDYKKLYEREASENERLRKTIADLEKSMENVKFASSKQASGEVSYVTPYNSRLEKLVAELEEENGTLEQIRADNIRLKEENGALIRVISKLSKSK